LKTEIFSGAGAEKIVSRSGCKCQASMINLQSEQDGLAYGRENKMGLDQYLYASNYLSGGEWQEQATRDAYAKVSDAIGAGDFENEEYPSITVKVKVGYWRKANQIHQWFVDNVQEGEDNCAEYYVSREQLQELNDVCMKVWKSKNKELAEELLPTQAGFFFGSYEIDEWYWEQVEDTLVQLGRILSKVPEGWSFAYKSSW